MESRRSGQASPNASAAFRPDVVWWVLRSALRLWVVTDFQERVTETNINVDLVVDYDDRFKAVVRASLSANFSDQRKPVQSFDQRIGTATVEQIGQHSWPQIESSLSRSAYFLHCPFGINSKEGC